MTVYVREREIVVPGQTLSDDSRMSGLNTYVHQGKVYSAVAGIVQLKHSLINVLPAKSPYRPSESDHVLGIITDIKPSHYEVDLGWHLIGILKALRRRPKMRLHIGDVIYTSVKHSGIRGVFLDSGEKLVRVERGLLIRVSPVKIPRIVGKKGSMVSLLSNESGCRLYVGRNGLIAVVGPSPEREFAVASAIRIIDEESHVPGLTERVASHLRKRVLGGEIVGEE